MTVSREALRAQWFGAHRAHRERIEASKRRPRLPIPDACPACQAPVARDGTLAYCAKRCGWFATPGGGRPVVAAEPAVSIRTPDSAPTDPEEDMTHDDDRDLSDSDDDLDTDEAPDGVAPEEAAPPARKARRRVARASRGKPADKSLAGRASRAAENREAVLAAIKAGDEGAEAILRRTGLHPSSLYRAFGQLIEAGAIVKAGDRRAPRYQLASKATRKPAGKPAPAVQVAPAEVPAAPAVATVLRDLASLSPAALDEVLDRLAPACAARANYLAFVRGLAV